MDTTTLSKSQSASRRFLRFGLALFMLLIGSAFKIQHWSRADMMLLFAFQSLCLVLLFMAKNPDWGMKKESV